MTRHGELAHLAAAQAFTAWLKVDTENHPGPDRLLCMSYESAPVYRSQVEALLEANRALARIANERGNRLAEMTEMTDHLKTWLCICPEGVPADFNPDADCPVHGDPTRLSPRMRDALKWRDAFEALHARILRDLPGDGSEVPQPVTPYWARAQYGVTGYAQELHEDLVERGLL